jgi:hypothetical protein
METLHPVAQVTSIIVIGLVAIVFILALVTDFFNNYRHKK